MAGQPAVYYEEGNSSAVVAPGGRTCVAHLAPQGSGPRGGEPYLDISIVCDANNVEELWAPDWVGYLTTLRDKLVESGVEDFPVPSFFLKSEWEALTKWSKDSGSHHRRAFAVYLLIDRRKG